jgi:hypothetical protein
MINYDLSLAGEKDDEQLWYGKTLVKHQGFQNIKKHTNRVVITKGLISDIYQKRLYFNKSIVDEFGTEENFNKDKKKSILEVKSWFEQKCFECVINNMAKI